MSLLWIDGFDSYGASVGSQVSPTDILAQKYATAAVSAAQRVGEGLWSGYSLALYNPADASTPSTPLINTDATIIVGFWFRTNYTSNYTRSVLALRDGSSVDVELFLDITNGRLIVVTAGVTRASVSYTNLNTWQFIELKATISDSGSWELRVGGATVASGSHDTRAGTNNYCNNVQLGSTGNVNFAFFYDHLYICNGAGSTNNNFLGQVKVATIRPSADTAEKDWTAQSGSDHYTMVDEEVADVDTTYIEASMTGDFDLFDYGNPSSIGSTIHGVQINTDCKETDATAYSLQTTIKSSSTVSDDTAQAIASAGYKTLRRISTTDPATGSAWTSSGINAAQFGVKVG